MWWKHESSTAAVPPPSGHLLNQNHPGHHQDQQHNHQELEDDLDLEDDPVLLPLGAPLDNSGLAGVPQGQARAPALLNHQHHINHHNPGPIQQPLIAVQQPHLQQQQQQDVLHNHPPLSRGCEDHWSWNKNDKSHEVRLCGPKQRIAHFHPNWSNGSAGVRGTRILNGGRYYWEITVSKRIFGTSMMFGIGTKKARLHVDAFVNMLGEDENSWGLSHKGLVWHNGQHRQYVKCFRENVSTTIGIYFDGVLGTLTYYKDGVGLGVAFTNLNEVKEPLYPIICSTAAKTEMSLGVLKRDYINLQDRCRAAILKQLTAEEQIDQLCLPLRIKQYISEGLENFQEDVALQLNNQMTHW